MTVLEVVEAGPYTSVQDRGRFGGQRYGLGPAGAMDQLSLAVANAVVGNPVFAAAIEIAPLPARFRAVGGDIRLAMTGATRGMTIAGRAVAMNETFVLAEDEVLTVRAASEGVFSTLAIEGGIRAEPVFGSLSMHARSGIGAPFARALMAGDRIPVATARLREAERSIVPPARGTGPLRVVAGPQDDHFTAEAMATLVSASWRISATSDRMGYRLEGPVLAHSKGHNIISDGIAFGAIQVPGNGQPLVLLADRGTTGGYPKIATIASVDLGRLAQIPVGSPVHFTLVPVAEAEKLARERHALVMGLAGAVREVGGGALSSEFLLAANLAGAAISGEE